MQRKEEGQCVAGDANDDDVLLVDLRAWDTFGEITVLVIAATGIASLIYRTQSFTAVENAAEIAAVDGVDQVFVVPSDLAASMGLLGQQTHPDVLEKAETDEIIGKTKVSALLEALPKVGKVKAKEIMEDLEIAQTRRLRGLGERQRRALLERFGYDDE